jgi:hypothetical protein
VFKLTHSAFVTSMLAALVAAACSDTSGPDSGDGVRLSVAVAQSASASQSITVPATDTAGNTLNITVAEIVVEEIEFETDDRDCDSSGPGNCHEFETGPRLISLPVSGGTLTIGTENVPFAFVSEIELDLERPDDDDAATQAFRAAHPNFPRNASLHLVGTFNGEAFDVFLSPEAELELEFDTPISLAEVSNLTIQIDVNGWLRNTNGTFIDPRTLSGSALLRDRVELNIRSSFRVFEDDDRDGRDN